MPNSILEGKKKSKQNPWWDDDGDGIGYEPGEVSGKFKKKKVKEAKEVKKWWDDDGDGIGYEPGEVSGKFKKKKKIKEGFSNWRQDLLEESDDKDETKKFKEGKVKNKIKTSAIGSGIQIGEEFGETGGVIVEVNEFDEINDIFSELNDHEISFLTDNLIENSIEEVLLDCLDEDYDISEVVDIIIENIDVNIDILNEAKVTYGHDTKIKSDKLQKVKSAVKSVGKKLARGAGYAAGLAVRGAKAAGREFASGYERGKGGSSSDSNNSSKKQKSSGSAPGIISRIGSKLKRGIKGVIARGARSLSRGARDVARKMEAGQTEKPSKVHSKVGTREPSPRSGIGGGKKVEVAGSPTTSKKPEPTPAETAPSTKKRPKATRRTTSVSSKASKVRRGQELRRQADEVLASLRNEDLDMDSNTNPQVANAKRELSTLDLKRTKLLTKIAQQKKQQREEYELAEREMTASDKAKEEKLKTKYDDSEMKQNMINQYGKEKGTQIYFAKIRKMAMEEVIDEAKLSRTEKRAKSAGKKKGRSKTMHLVDLDANAMKPKKKGVEAEIEVKKGGKTVRSLNPQQFNTDKKKDDEKYDFGQFASSKVFKKTLKGNKHVRNLHRGGEASGLTARGKMDKPREVVKHIKSTGFKNLKGVHFTGDVPGKGTDDKKMKVIKHLIKTKKPKQIKFSDDHAKNLEAPERFNREEGKDKTKNRGSSIPKIKTYLTRDDGRPKRFGSGGRGIRNPQAVNKASSPQEKQKRRKQARMGEEFSLSED